MSEMAKEIGELFTDNSICIIPRHVTEIYNDYMRLDPKFIESYEQKNIKLVQEIEKNRSCIDDIKKSYTWHKTKIIGYISQEINNIQTEIEQNEKIIKQCKLRLDRIKREYRTINFNGPVCCIGREDWYEFPYQPMAFNYI